MWQKKIIKNMNFKFNLKQKKEENLTRRKCVGEKIIKNEKHIIPRIKPYNKSIKNTKKN